MAAPNRHANSRAKWTELAAKNRGAADEFVIPTRGQRDADLLGRSYSEIARKLNDGGL